MPNLNDFLYETEREMVSLGLPKIKSDSLRAIGQYIQHPEFQQLVTSGQLTAKMLAQNVLQAVQASGGQSQGQPLGGPSAGQPNLPLNQQLQRGLLMRDAATSGKMGLLDQATKQGY